MTLYLGLDGGGTGCRATLTDADGHVLGRGEGGPCNIMSDPDRAVAALRDCAAAALGGHDPAQVRAVLGLAGVSTSGAAKWLPPLLPFGVTQVVQDAVTAAAGALGDADGIVAAMGTGSIFIRQQAGQVVTLGGWGPILGDEGGGNWLGRRLLTHVLRSVDGLAEATALTRAVLAEHGGPSGVVAFARDAAAADFGRQARVLLTAPDDPAARKLMAEAADAVSAAITRLQPDRALPVSFTGGLGPAYAALLADRWAQVPPLGTPLDGALLLARRLSA